LLLDGLGEVGSHGAGSDLGYSGGGGQRSAVGGRRGRCLMGITKRMKQFGVFHI
jgi:hypothetical protein